MIETDIQKNDDLLEEVSNIDIEKLRIVPFQVVKVPDMDEVAVTLSIGLPLPQPYTDEDVGRLKVKIIKQLKLLVDEIIKD